MQKLHVYQASVAMGSMSVTDRHQPLCRAQSSPATADLNNPSPEKPVEHLFTTGKETSELASRSESNTCINVN